MTDTDLDEVSFAAPPMPTFTKEEAERRLAEMREMGRNTPLTASRLPVSMGDEEEPQKPKKPKKPRQKAEQQPAAPDPDFAPSAPDPRFFRPVKGRLTMRVDSDILAAYKATGPGFQKLMNKALRAGMPR